MKEEDKCVEEGCDKEHQCNHCHKCQEHHDEEPNLIRW